MATFPIWFGCQKRQLFGQIYLPERAVGGFVLCPPIGIEGSPGYRGLTVLAERLAAAGHVVLRFDYTGTGDSAGDIADVPTVDSWIRDIGFAVELVRSTGVPRVGVVGLRIGALLAAHVASSTPFDALALWDPCLTGRGFLREQQILGAVISSVSEGGSPSPTAELGLPGIALPRGFADSLSRLDLDSDNCKFPDEVLVLTRPDRPTSDGLRDRLATVHAAWDEAPEQQVFFESHWPYMPRNTIDRIATWCEGVFPAADSDRIVPRQPPGSWSSTVHVDKASTAKGFTERPVTIEPRGLFGILTEFSAGDGDHSSQSVVGAAKGAESDSTHPIVLLINLAGDRRTGPSRLWVDLARLWAGNGARVLRLDVGGVGDSPPRPGAERYLIFPPGGIDDVIAAAQFLSPDDPAQVLLVGVCSGAYHAAEAAVTLKSKAVWLFNPGLPFASDFRQEDEVAIEATQRRATRRADPVSRRLNQMEGFVSFAHRVIPNPGWWLLDKLGLYTYLIKAFDPLLDQGTETFLVCGESESVPYLTRGHRALRRRLRSGRLHFEEVKTLDHALQSPASRRTVMLRLDDYLAPQLGVNRTSARNTSSA